MLKSGILDKLILPTKTKMRLIGSFAIRYLLIHKHMMQSFYKLNFMEKACVF